MGAKSRGNFQVAACFKDCANRDKRCDDCWRYDNYKKPRNRRLKAR
jgi:hypothetical protein